VPGTGVAVVPAGAVVSGTGAAVVAAGPGAAVVPVESTRPVQTFPLNPYQPDKVMFKVLSERNKNTCRMKTASTWQASAAHGSALALAQATW